VNHPLSADTLYTPQEELAALSQNLSTLYETLDQQREALQNLQSSWAATDPFSPEAQAVREALASAVAISSVVQELEELLAQMGQALERLQGDLSGQRNEHEQLVALYKVSRAVNSTLDLEELLNLVMDTIISLTGAERGFLMLIDEETGELNFKVARNMDRETIEGSSFEISRTIVRQVASEGVPVLTTNAQADPRFKSQLSVVSYSLRSILCVPLRVKDKIIGVIYTDNRIRDGLFSEQDRDLLVAFADQAAVAIQNAQLFESVVNARNLMANILASIASGVITTDIMDRITLFNRAAERILGIPAHQCENRPYHEALAPLRDVLSRLVEEVKKRERQFIGYEVDSELPDRGMVSLSMSLSPLKNAQDETQGVAIVVEDLTEKKRYERDMAMIRRYLPPELIESLPDDLSELQLGGKRQVITTLFADIRGFTTYSETHAPEQVVEVINHYFNIAGKIIRAQEGIVDKYQGDCVMANFNTPLHEVPDHALRAVRTAWEIQQAIKAYHQKMPSDSRLQLGIGINTGEAVVGNVGAEDRMEYTAIGDAVNLAKRLQEEAGPGQILLGQSTYELVKDHVIVNKLEPIQVKGRSALEQVYELVGLK